MWFVFQVNTHLLGGESYSVERNIRYSAQDSRNILDLYLPKDFRKQRNSAVVLVHGGGFRGGDKEQKTIVAFSESLASRGFIVATMNYRLHLTGKGSDTSCTANMGAGLLKDGFHPELRYAVNIAATDVRDVLSWLDTNASRYRLSQISLMGGSAGAMAALYATFGELPDSEWDIEISAVVSLWGGLEDPSLVDQNVETRLLIIHGDEDTVINPSFSRDLHQNAQDNRMNSLLIPLAGEGHGAYKHVLTHYMDRIADFLKP